ncbi:MAG: hypothetical protein SGILL_009466, partial [Bacillariaceae sp.]
IVFGATGVIGLGLIDLLSTENPGWEIFAVTRSESSEKFAQYNNVNVLQGDPKEKDKTMDLCADKDLIFCTLGISKYEAKHWAQEWPLIVDNLLAASAQNPKQKFVFCDNLYAYGSGRDISPKSELVEPSLKTKPAIRSMLHAKLQARMDKTPDSIAVVGGADFFGPGVTQSSFLGDTFTKAIVSGKSRPLAMASASKLHDCAYTRDFSKALYIAGTDDKANGKFWICPHAVKNKTLQDLANDVAEITYSEKRKVLVIPGWAVRVTGFVDSFMKEMVEMLPIWREDYTVDDSDFCKVFNVQPTPYDVALKEYVDFYKEILSA